MKNILKFITILGTFALVYYAGDLTIKYFMPENHSIANSALLFTYGGMIGYILLIIFVVVLQKNNYDQLVQHKPRFGRLLHNFHIMLAIVFIIYALISFDIQFSVLLVLIFLFVSTLLDYVREKLMQEINGNPIHPKKIL
ncbi:MAG: hypothetical protein KKH01_00125 [Firmicutes bacterium]|nr:hypothetical protein [Bacillota bacterium]